MPANTASERFPELLVKKRGLGGKGFLTFFVTISLFTKTSQTKILPSFRYTI